MNPPDIWVFDHVDHSGLPMPQFYEARLDLIAQYDRLGFYGYHCAEHQLAPSGMVPCHSRPRTDAADAAEKVRRLRRRLDDPDRLRQRGGTLLRLDWLVHDVLHPAPIFPQPFLRGSPALRLRAPARPDPTILTSFNQTGQVKKVRGGYEIGGRWDFASGGDYCQWGIVGGVTRAEDGRVEKRLNFLLRPDQFGIDRVWNAMGLRGSGSNDVIVEPTFVPDAFVYDHDDALVGRAPGHAVNEGVLYRSPLILNSGFAVMTPMHGIARGAWESFVELTAGRGARPMGAKPSDRAEVQIAIDESQAEIDLAYLVTEKLTATIFKGRKVSRVDAVRQRRDMMMVLKLLQRAVDRVFDLSGAHGILGDDPIQRH